MINNQTIKKVKADQDFQYYLWMAAKHVKKLIGENPDIEGADKATFISSHGEIHHVIFKGSEEDRDNLLDCLAILQLKTPEKDLLEKQKQMREQILHILDYGFFDEIQNNEIDANR